MIALMIRLGFTGTGSPITDHQRLALRQLFVWVDSLANRVELHHGDCINADAEAHKVAAQLDWRIVIHPPTNPRRRAWCESRHILPTGEYLARNKDIVRAGEHFLVAVPRDFAEERRSGTWHAVRYARSLRRPIYYVWPNGRIEFKIRPD